MKRLFLNEWFGIKFKTFSKLDQKKIAGIDFYDAFYDEFNKKYNSFEQLPDDWKKTKNCIINFLRSRVPQGGRIVSIGCGNGYVEYMLVKSGKQVVAIEPSVKATKLLERHENVSLCHGFFPECLKNAQRVDNEIGYMGAVEYVFNDSELQEMLRKIKEYAFNEFYLITVRSDSVLQNAKKTMKAILSLIGLLNWERKAQLWGYVRTPKELTNLFLKTGFRNIESGFIDKDIFWIKGS